MSCVYIYIYTHASYDTSERVSEHLLQCDALPAAASRGTESVRRVWFYYHGIRRR